MGGITTPAPMTAPLTSTYKLAIHIYIRYYKYSHNRDRDRDREIECKEEVGITGMLGMPLLLVTAGTLSSTNMFPRSSPAFPGTSS